MKDPSYNIRVAEAELLAGILWAGNQVPVYDEMAPDTAPDIRIIFQEINGGGAPSTKCGFGGDWSRVIKVTQIFPGTARVNKDAVDHISSEILTRLVPLYPTMDLGPEFTLWRAQGFIIGNQTYEDGSNKYIDKNIRITYSITEN